MAKANELKLLVGDVTITVTHNGNGTLTAKRSYRRRKPAEGEQQRPVGRPRKTPLTASTAA